MNPALKWGEGLAEPIQCWAGVLSVGPAHRAPAEGSGNLCAAAVTERSLKSTALGSKSTSRKGFSGANSWKWEPAWLGEEL